MCSEVFLAIDSPSVDPFASSPASLDAHNRDDHKGFILAVDACFDLNDPDAREDESPGYRGELRILSSLVWSDLYAMLAAQTQGPTELWPLAMQHPNNVYVGPVVQVQIEKRRQASSR